jgi:tricorn protease-like protein
VLATLRSDYLEAFQQSADLQGVSFAPILLPAMSRDALGEAIARPVERVGLTMAPALVDRLKNASLTRNRFLSWRSCCAIYRRLITIGLGSVTGQREEVVLWDLAGRKPLGDVIARQPAGITSVAFSPDGTLLAAGSEDHTVLLWDVVNRKHLCEPLAAHSGAVSSVAFSPDGRLLATGSQDKTILIWDMISRARARVPLDAHQDAIHTVAFSPDGQVLASGSEDQTIILWDVLNSRPLSAPLADHRFPVRSVAFTPDGQYLAAATSMPQLAPHSQRVALKPIARENSTAFPPGSSSGP